MPDLKKEAARTSPLIVPLDVGVNILNVMDQLPNLLGHQDLLKVVAHLDDQVDELGFTVMLSEYFDLRRAEREEKALKENSRDAR